MQRIFFIYVSSCIDRSRLAALRCASPEFPRRLSPRSVLRSRSPSITAKTLLVHFSVVNFLVLGALPQDEEGKNSKMDEIGEHVINHMTLTVQRSGMRTAVADQAKRVAWGSGYAMRACKSS